MFTQSLIFILLSSFSYSYFVPSRYKFAYADVKIPPVDQPARMARYIVHNSKYCVLSHITHQRNATGYPMGRVFSISDGIGEQSTGTPYFYSSHLDGVVRDLKIDNKCALTMSLVQGDYCTNEGLDPENPRCAQVMMIGHFQFLKNGSEEWNFAQQALFSRHPEMKNWPDTHNFEFGKFLISNVQIVDYFGGSKYPTVPEYYNAPPEVYKRKSYLKDFSFLNSVYRVHLI